MAVLQKLGHHPGIVACELSDDGIKMPYMKNGDLSRYWKYNSPPEQWIKALAGTIAYIHSCHVIVGDNASHNVLVDHNYQPTYATLATPI
jgi:serine/threonine protein kinase